MVGNDVTNVQSRLCIEIAAQRKPDANNSWAKGEPDFRPRWFHNSATAPNNSPASKTPNIPPDIYASPTNVLEMVAWFVPAMDSIVTLRPSGFSGQSARGIG